jgi:hypothetical protein
MGGYDKYVRQLKLSLLLPLMQLFLAAGLWDWGHRTATTRVLDTFYWPTSVLICYGINAPALVLKLLAFPFTRRDQVTPPSISGYGLEELFFFLGVGILWFTLEPCYKEPRSERRQQNTSGSARLWQICSSSRWGLPSLSKESKGFGRQGNGIIIGEISRKASSFSCGLSFSSPSRDCRSLKGFAGALPKRNPIERNLHSQA